MAGGCHIIRPIRRPDATAFADSCVDTVGVAPAASRRRRPRLAVHARCAILSWCNRQLRRRGAPSQPGQRLGVADQAKARGTNPPWHQAARRWVARPRCSANSASISRLNAGMSPGCRLVTRFRSRTTSRSSQVPPAFRTSSCSVGIAGQPAVLDQARGDQDPWRMADDSHRLASRLHAADELRNLRHHPHRVGVQGATWQQQGIELVRVACSSGSSTWESPPSSGRVMVRAAAVPQHSGLRGHARHACGSARYWIPPSGVPV